MGLILLILLIRLLVGGLPRWEYSRKSGYAPSGTVFILLRAGVVTEKWKG